MERFTDKVVLVTGAGGVVGRCASLAFAREGATVIVADLSEPAVKETVRQIEEEEGQASGVLVDVTDSSSVASMVATTVERHGGLDVAFNNAGILDGVGPISEGDEEAWNRVLSVNLTGVYHSLKHELAHMIRNGGGAIVNTASNIGAHQRLEGLAAYATSKAGVSMLTRTAAREAVGHGVRINAVSPGPIDTPMSLLPGETHEQRAARFAEDVPLGRIADPEEIVATVLWLASPDASFVVGHDLVIDGGVTA